MRDVFRSALQQQQGLGEVDELYNTLKQPLEVTVDSSGALALTILRHDGDSPFSTVVEAHVGGGACGQVFEVTVVCESGEAETFVCKMSEWDDHDSVVEAALYTFCAQHDIGPRVPEGRCLLRLAKRELDDSIIAPLVEHMSATHVSLLLMEPFDMSLSQFLDSEQPSDGELASIETQIRDKMQRLADLGVVCVDQKPENVLIRRTPQGGIDVVLTDFDSKFCCGTRRSNSLGVCTSTSADLVLPILFTQIHLLEPRLFATEATRAAVLLGNDIDVEELSGHPNVGDSASERFMRQIGDDLSERRAMCDTESVFQYYTKEHPTSIFHSLRV
jgi:hypothetical protein